MIFYDVVLLGLAVGYLTQVLLLEEKDSHEGPFKVQDWVVVIDGHVQNFVFFDFIRFATGVYSAPYRSDKVLVFQVRDGTGAYERWTCPKCLSFWVALPFSSAYSLFYQTEWFHFVVIFLAVTAISSWYNRDV